MRDTEMSFSHARIVPCGVSSAQYWNSIREPSQASQCLWVGHPFILPKV